MNLSLNIGNRDVEIITLTDGTVIAMFVTDGRLDYEILPLLAKEVETFWPHCVKAPLEEQLYV